MSDKDENEGNCSSSSGESKVEEEKIPEPLVRRNDSKTNVIVLMKAQTWNRESHGLYDYESRHVHKLETKAENEGYMIRGKEDVMFVQDLMYQDETEDTVLFNLKRKPAIGSQIEKFYISPINSNEPNDRLWIVIRSMKDGYLIKKHDILKLGRMKFKVKEYRTEHEFYEGEHAEKSPHEGFEEVLEVHQSTDNETP